MFLERSDTLAFLEQKEAVMQRFLLDVTAFVSCSSCVGALYLWISVLPQGV